MISVNAMQMPVVDVVEMVAVTHRFVTASCAMLVIVVLMNIACIRGSIKSNFSLFCHSNGLSCTFRTVFLGSHPRGWVGLGVACIAL